MEKQSPDNTGKESSDKYYYLNGERIEVAPDLLELKEIDYNDPNVKKWLAEREAESIRLYGHLTCEEADYMYSRRLELQKKFPQKSVVELNQQALREFRTAKG